MLTKDVAQTQHGKKWIVANEPHIRHCLVGIIALAPGHELGITPHHGRFVTPHVLRADEHRAVRIRHIHDAVIARMLI